MLSLGSRESPHQYLFLAVGYCIVKGTLQYQQYLPIFSNLVPTTDNTTTVLSSFQLYSFPSFFCVVVGWAGKCQPLKKNNIQKCVIILWQQTIKIIFLFRMTTMVIIITTDGDATKMLSFFFCFQRL